MRRRAVLTVLVLALAACSSKSEPSRRAAAAEPTAPATLEPRPPPSGKEDVVILAGGCFWGMEELLRKIDGVLDTEVGYAGGEPATASYDQVHHGNTGHAEAVRVVFDPERISFADLLEHWFFRMHDPTTLDRQGNDVGSQYRSAIFFTSEAQRRTAEEVKARVDRSGSWDAPLVTVIEQAGPFTRGEAYHQDYLQENPDGYTCHFMRD